jgi:uncharacterized protein (TIGR02145 family)
MNTLNIRTLATAILCSVAIFAIAQPPVKDCGTVTDIDGNVYQTVMMGDECWLRENLRVMHYADGKAISPTPAAPNADSSRVATYGRLYTWFTVLNGSEPTEETDGRVQGPCPDGWHVPSNFEWMGIEDYVGYKDYYRCGTDVNNVAKAMSSTDGWQFDFLTQGAGCCVIENVATNNSTGFSVLPAGSVWNGQAEGFGTNTGFWTCSDGSPDTSPIHRFYYTNATVEINCTPKEAFYSVRCVKNKN